MEISAILEWLQKANPASLDAMEEVVFALMEKLGASPLNLPHGLGYMEAPLHEQTVQMRSFAWQTRQYRLIRLTLLFCPGRIRSFNFVIYPFSQYDAPIFATDFLHTGEKVRVAVIDAMPLFPDDPGYDAHWVAPFAPWHEASLALAPVYQRKLSWSTKFLGRCACLATGIEVRESQGLCQLWGKYLATYLAATWQLEPARDDVQQAVAEWHLNYNQEHLAVELQRNPFMHYFGHELGKRYNEEFLFSDQFGLFT